VATDVMEGQDKMNELCIPISSIRFLIITK